MAAPSNISVVTERGQVSIPSHLRRELGLEKGRRLLWEKLGDHEIRLVVLPDVQPKGARAMLGFARRFRPTRSSRDWMSELREGER
ncbi:MAG TPA: AbrB/MazE/SpoVT family DNA-binding domain-containing protein [Thermoanaerobaculia bacterium]|nr:AbrB/MazE/SpoVT family DNA-binding domain-containing protein [Thermoanaerobaculia bacterium]